MRSSCKGCDQIAKRLAYKPRENPKIQPKQQIFDISTRAEMRQCSACGEWSPLPEFFMHGRFRSNLCKPCERTQARERARYDPERGRANARTYALANPEKVRANLQKWRAENREHLLEYNRRPEKQAYQRELMRRKRMSGEAQAYQREYRRRFPDKGAEKAARRRATLAKVSVEPVSRMAIILRDGRICYLCGKHLKWREVTLDHVIPLARGGPHTAANLRVACGPCNSGKGIRNLATLPLGI